jgi:phenylacetate-coenzyme A ligase PaaK-like adenylate-forming protein
MARVDRTTAECGHGRRRFDVNHWLERIYERSPIALQDLYVSWYGRRILSQRFNHEFDDWMALFERSQWWSADELAAHQDRLLTGLVAHCYETVPYYRNVMDERGLRPADVSTRLDLRKLPIITKDTIRKDPGSFLARGLKVRNLKESPTSGTTGASFSVLWDRATDVLWNALLWRHRSWSGFKFGTRYASLLGRVVVPLLQSRPPFWRWNRPWNQVLFSAFHLKADNIGAYVDALRAFEIQALECYPSTGYILARFLEDRGEILPLKHVVSSSETLLPIQREVMERVFQTKVLDYYGMSEAVLFAGECGQGSGYHLHAEIGFAEVVDERGETLPTGRHGRLLGSGLVNRAMPLLRYEIGDVSALRTERCPCGRTLPLLDSVTTKAEDIVIAPDGRLISSSTLTHPFKPLVRVEKSQIVQEATDRIVIRIVPRAGYGEEDSQHLLREMQRRLGPDMRIRVEIVDDIPLGPSGKYRWVVSNIPLEFRQGGSGNLFGPGKGD